MVGLRGFGLFSLDVAVESASQLGVNSGEAGAPRLP